MSDLLYTHPSDNVGSLVTPVVFAGTTMNALYPLTRLVDKDPATTAKSSTTGDYRIVWDYTTPQRIDGVWIPMYNWPAGVIPRFEGHTSNTWAGPTVSRSRTTPAYRGDLPRGLFFDIRTDPAYTTTGLQFWSLFVPNAGLITAIGDVYPFRIVRETVNVLAPLDEAVGRRVTMHPRNDGGYFKYDRGTDTYVASGRVLCDDDAYADYDGLHADAKGVFSPFGIVLNPDDATPEGRIVQWPGDFVTSKIEGHRGAGVTWQMVPRGRAL